MSVIPENPFPDIVPDRAGHAASGSTQGVVDGGDLERLERILLAADFEQTLRACVAALAGHEGGVQRAFALARANGADELRELARSENGTLADARPPSGSTIATPDDPCVKALGVRVPVAGAAASPHWTESGVERVIAVALRVEEYPIAVLAVEPAAGNAESDEETWPRLLRVLTVAESALARAHQATEIRQWAHQAQLLQEMSHATLSHMNVAEGLSRVTRIACQALNARGSALWVAGARAESLRLESTFGPAANRERVARGLEAVAHDCLATRRIQCVEAPDQDPRLLPDVATALRAVVFLPIVAYDEVRGVLALYDPFPRSAIAPPGFSRSDLAFLALLSDQAAVILENTKLFERIRRGEKRIEDDRGHLLQLERLAGLGELSARVAQEARHPLSAIGGFARRALKATGPEDPQRDCLDVIVREADRLERLLAEQLQFALSLQARMEHPLIQSVLQECSEGLVRKRVRLLKKLAPDLSQLLLDAEKIKQVLRNVLAHALAAAPMGGRLRVESRRVQRFVVIEVAHDGPRASGDMAEQLFVPFALAKTAAPGPALAVARQIVHVHGGEIRLRSEGDWGTIFSFTLPVNENQDRRAHPASDRRRSRPDRRNRYPVA
jgi:signal transduction histidine kinase